MQEHREKILDGPAREEIERATTNRRLVEAFVADHQQYADPIQRIFFAAPVTERLLLDAAADLVPAAVGDPHNTKRVRHPRDVVEMR